MMAKEEMSVQINTMSKTTTYRPSDSLKQEERLKKTTSSASKAGEIIILLDFWCFDSCCRDWHYYKGQCH